MNIIEVVKDTGGMHAVRPVGDALIAMGHTVHRFASGVSTKTLDAQQSQYCTAQSTEDVLAQCGIPDVVLTSMCSAGGIGRDLVPLVRGKVVVVAIQDQWGSRLITDWHDSLYRPDHIVVNDPVGVRLVGKAWPEFPVARVHPIGYAALDALHCFDRVAERVAARRALALDDNVPLVYVSGQFAGSAAMLDALLQALPKSFSGKVLLGKHPRMDPSNPVLKSEWERWQNVAMTMPVVEPAAGLAELERIAAADVVVSMFSTALMHAAALRVPAISVVFPGSEMQQAYANETGGLLSVHPLVELGCVAGPTSVLMLREHLSDALRGALVKQLRPAQDVHLRVDSNNALRIAQFISTLEQSAD